MFDNKVISRKNLPVRLPTTKYAVVGIILYLSNAPGWVIGVVATVMTIHFILAFWLLTNEKSVDVFDEGSDRSIKKTPSKFRQRLNQAMKDKINNQE